MEVVVQDEAAGVSTATPAEDPPRGASPAERVAAAPVLQRPVRPPRRQRLRRVDTLTTMSSQCARSLEQGDEVLQNRGLHNPPRCRGRADGSSPEGDPGAGARHSARHRCAPAKF
ncbi:uncharacterized protein LOC142576365 [Dermacentor variabilis]|uniref:uncharacterized protein LOC142576365 n=1 Tax=Dermacentor variabilis TaxID=34621 RepID=UPI003F5C04D2